MLRLNNQKGLSLIEVLVSSVIVSIAALSVGSVLYQFYSTVKDASSQRTLSYLHSEVQENLKAMINPRPGSNDKEVGLCSLMSTKALSYGTTKVSVDFQKFGEKISTTKNWDDKFSSRWSEISCPSELQVKSVGKCYQMKPASQEADSQLVGYEKVYMKAEFSLVWMDPTTENQKPFSPINISESNPELLDVDAKRMMILLSSTLIGYPRNTNKNEQISKSEIQNIIWAADVGICPSVLGDGVTPAKLAPSGTGLGDPTGTTVFNSSLFEEPGQEPVEMYLANRNIARRIVTRGLSGTISVDPEGSVSAVCSEAQFRCKNSKNSRSFFDEMRVQGSLNYYPVNKYGTANSARTYVKMEIISSTNSSAADLANSSYKSYAINGRSYLPVDANNPLRSTDGSELSLSPGRSSIDTRISGAARFCPQICEDSSPQYNVKLTAKLWGLMLQNQPVTVSQVFSEPVACNICYSKTCGAVGQLTFGRLEDQPNEAADNGMPECAIQDGDSSLNKLDPFPKADFSYPLANKCIAAKIQNGFFSYSVENCEKTLPVLCYNYGTFMLARTNTATPSVKNLTAAQASRACYEIGNEQVQTQKLNEFFSTGLPPAEYTSASRYLAQLPQSGGNYQFNNNARQGIFLAPQLDWQKQDAARTLRNFQSFTGSDSFWVALRTDATGEIVSQLPKLTNAQAQSSDRSAVFYRSNATPAILSFPALSSNMRIAAAGEEKAFILFHHLQYKGVVEASKTQPRNFQFLCRRKTSPFGFFVTQNSSRQFSDGASICKSYGAEFVPPAAPLQWAQAMLALAPNGYQYGFPEPDFSMAIDPRGVWVGIENKSSTDKSLDVPSIVLPNWGQGSDSRTIREDGSFAPNHCPLKKITKKIKISSNPDSYRDVTKWVPDAGAKIICESEDGNYTSTNSACSGRQVEYKNLFAGLVDGVNNPSILAKTKFLFANGGSGLSHGFYRIDSSIPLVDSNIELDADDCH